jgi:tetratricopeptide (TPR) repeat protein
MGKAYEGHPLVIEVIAGEILDQPFNGNVVAYWNKYRQEFEAIEAAISHQELQLRVKDRVRKSLERLQQDVPYAYTLLLRSSVYRHPVPESFWHWMLWSCTEQEKATALGTIESRYLVFREAVTHTGQFLLRQHNLIRNTAYELLKKISNQGLEWQDDHYIAAEMWHTGYEPDPDASNLEKVQGYLEAFHHLCEVGDWEQASQILSIRLDIPTNEELHNQLGIWGYYLQQIQLYSTILGKLNDAWNCICYSGLGNAYKSLGDYPQAIGYHQQSLRTARKICNRKDEGTALGNLGNVYYSLGDYPQAIGYHQQSLTIFREIGDRYGEGTSLGNLGNAYDSLGNYPQAIEYHQQHLTIAREIGDRYGEGSAVGNLAVTLFQLEQYSEALENLQAALNIFREIGYRSFEAITLNNLAKLYLKLGDRALAIEYWDKALEIFIQLGVLQARKAQELKEKLLSEEA